MRHVAIGASIVVATVALSIWISSFVIERLRFSATSVGWGRLTVASLVAVALFRFVVYPLVRRVSDARLALYLEERVPSLDGAVISAVEVHARPADEVSRSPLLTRGLVSDAVRRLRTLPEVPTIEQSQTRRALIALGLLLVATTSFFLLGPDYLRQGSRLLLVPWQTTGIAPVYSIEVTPGDLTVARGSDVQIDATLNGFRAELVEVAIRRGTDDTWERLAMGPTADSLGFRARLFDVAQDAEYYVEASGVRSRVARLTVRDLPAVENVSVVLHFPAYTHLPSETIDDGGDIAAIVGTRAFLRVRASRKVVGGRLVLDEGKTSIPLGVINDTTLGTTITVRHDGFYAIELEAEDGTRVPGTVQYIVDALEDAPPSVTIGKPGRDYRPTTVEEVLIESTASDDYGVGRMELAYRVNGGEEKVVSLTDGSGARLRDLTASHTLFLEEMSLVPGDVIAYYVRAWDNNPAQGANNKAASDIYFLTVRPLSRDFRQNQQAGGGGGGGGEMNPGALVQLQREVISATYKAQRDSLTTNARTLREDVATIHLSQGRLRTRLDELIERLKRPAVQAADSNFRILLEIMPKAREEMQKAEEDLAAVELTDALSPEQRALQWLERAEAVYREVQVNQQQQGGGGGGGQNANAEDLADLLELETDKLRNQYEQVQRSQSEQAQQQLDETLERLKRLAARQQQENERQRQRASGGGAGGSQRQLADEAEQLARQLERLSREQKSQEMQETARRMQDAANEMRRSAAQSSSSSSGAGGAASQQLAEARRLLEEARDKQTNSGVQQAAGRAAELAERQREVSREVAAMGAQSPGSNRSLDQRKQTMAQDVGALERDLDRAARAERNQRSGTAQSMREGAQAIRERRIDDRIEFSRETMYSQSREYASNVERQIQSDLDSLSARLGRAAGRAQSLNDSSMKSSRALNQARDLVRALASIDERMRERAGGQSRRLDSLSRGGAAGERGAAPNGSRENGSQQGNGQSQRGPQRQGDQPPGQQDRGAQQGQARQQAAPGQQGQQGQPGQQGQAQPGQQGQGQQGSQGARGQGQGGQRGDQGQRGLDSQDPQGSPGRERTPNGQLGGNGQGGPGRLSAEDARQFARDFRAQRNAAEDLRRNLAGTGIAPEDLDRIIQRLRELESGRTFNDPEELEALRAAVLDGMKEFEFGLRRQLATTESKGPVLGGSDDVPAAYRDLVNRYFRTLSQPKRP